MKPRHIVLAVALVAAAALVLFGDNEPAVEVVESVERAAPSPRAAAAAAQAAPERRADVMRLIPREELIGDAAGQGGAFHTQSWNPPAPVQQQQQQARPEPPAPPAAPPFPFAFIGKTLGGGHWEIHLAQGDRLQTVRPGDVIDGAWRIDAVAPPVMTVTYLPLGQVQQMNIGANE